MKLNSIFSSFWKSTKKQSIPDIDPIYNINNSDPVLDFHSRRRMFAIKDSQLYIAPKEVSYSHAEWFGKLGWFEISDSANIPNFTRGFVDSRGIFFYRGLDFEADTACIEEMLKHIGVLVHALSISLTKHLYAGVEKQPEIVIWPPKVDLGEVRQFIG